MLTPSVNYFSKSSMPVSLLVASICCLLIGLPDRVDAADWKLLPVPETWKRPARGSGADKDGFMWYRCSVEIPSEWAGEALEMVLEGIDDAREIYFNGTLVGRLGSLPPQFRSGLGQSPQLAIPPAAVRPAQANVVAIRVFKARGARENFNVAAPVILTADEAIRLSGKWQFRSGDDLSWAKLKADDDTPVYKDRISSDIVAASLKRLGDDDGPLSPEQSLKRIKVPDDLHLDLVLADPTIGQPLSMKWDERGRLWLVEYLQYPNPAGLKMLSRDKYLRTVYDKVPPAPPNHFRGADRVTIHEDSDGDGVYDKHKTFVDGLSLVSSVAIGRGGVWVLNPPYLLFYPDKNGDDVPDGDPVVHLEGFGIEDSHSIANSMRWGPDGWLYAAQGSTVTGNIKRPGSEDQPVHSMGQLIWRYHPESRRYEIFAEGGGNAFGVEIDSKGRLYSGHNGGNTRGFHYVQGGYFRKGFGKHGELSNPYTFGYFPHMPHPNVPRFTHTFVIYEGGAMPPKYDEKLFGVGPLQSHVVYSEVEPAGSSFKTRDLGHPFTSSDPWVRPVDIQVGPDGAIYVADFYEQRIDHASHYQGRVHKSSGRIYRLRAKGSRKQVEPFDYAKLSSQKLVDALSHKNKWHRQTILRLLGDRRDNAIVAALRRRLFESDGQLALDKLWALNLSGGLDQATALRALDHNDPHVRLWTIRLLCDQQRVSPSIQKRVVKMADVEPNVETRCQMACSAKRLPAEQGLPIVRGLLARSEDTNDVYIPLLLWWAIESKCDSDRNRVLAMFRDQETWQLRIVRDHITERLMRRFAQAGRRADLLTCAELLELAPTKEDAKKLLAGFEAAFEGRALKTLPQRLVDAIAKTGGGSLELRVRQAEPKAVAEALKVVSDEKAKAAQRAALLEIFGQINEPRAVPVMLRILKTSKDQSVKRAALESLQNFAAPEIGTVVVEEYGSLPSSLRDLAQTLLSSRSSWSLHLLGAVDRGEFDKNELSLQTVRHLLMHSDKNIADLVNKHWGTVAGATSGEMRDSIEHVKQIVKVGSGNPYQGQELFRQNCGKCHVLFGEGGFVGPDLTSYRRDDLQRMLSNIVNPSLEIREGFENYVVATDDGRVASGFIADQDNNVVLLRGTEGQTTVIPRDQIEAMRAVKQSIMPEGLLDKYSDQQIRDLFAYLRATQPLP